MQKITGQQQYKKNFKKMTREIQKNQGNDKKPQEDDKKSTKRQHNDGKNPSRRKMATE